MIYEYKKLGIRIIANSKEEAIENILKAPKYKITAMSFDRDKLEKEIREQTPNIVIWWCLCWYLKNIENKNGLLHHEKVKLKGLLRKISSRRFKGKNTNRIKKKILEEYWIEGCEFNKDTEAVISEFMSKFDSEGIDYNENLYQNIAKEFGKEVNKVIKIICEESYSKIDTYVESIFKE